MCASLRQESLWSRLFWLLFAADCLRSCAFSLFNNPSRLLQQRSPSLLPKSFLNWQKLSKSEQLRCSAISQNFVILGGSGDLATTKIIPGLFDLCKQFSVLSKSTNSSKSPRQIGFDHDAASMGPSTDFNYDDFSVKLAARSVWSDDFLKDKLRNILSSNIEESSAVKSLHDQLVSEFLAKCSYTCIESYDSTAMSNLLDTHNSKEYDNAGKVKVKKVRNIVYFALPPKQYLPALNAIKDIQNNEIYEINEHDEHQKIENVITSETSEAKNEKNVVQDNDENHNDDNSNNDNNENLIEIVLEKPIGYDIATALEITKLALSAVKNREENIWCVDHYLAKDLAVAILPLKTSQIPSISRLFLEYWNKDYISDVNIIFSDTGILDGRSGYFDECGITRDILQNHLIQLLALLCADIDMILNFNENMDYSDNLKKEMVIINDYIKSNKILNNDNNEICITNNTSSDINIDNNDNNNNNNDNDNNNNNHNNNDNNTNNHIGKKWMDIKSDDRSNLVSEMRANILNSISPLQPTDLILGQYDSYSTEKGVKINTKTSTFSSCQIQVR